MNLLDIFAGYKTYVIGGLMLVHGLASLGLDFFNGHPVNQLNMIEAGAGLTALTARRAVDR